MDGADRGHTWVRAVGWLGIGYSQNYFHMVQRPLIMSRTVVAWLPPSQHHPFHPRLSGEITTQMEGLVVHNCVCGSSAQFTTLV